MGKTWRVSRLAYSDCCHKSRLYPSEEGPHATWAVFKADVEVGAEGWGGGGRDNPPSKRKKRIRGGERGGGSQIETRQTSDGEVKAKGIR